MCFYVNNIWRRRTKGGWQYPLDDDILNCHRKTWKEKGYRNSKMLSFECGIYQLLNMSRKFEKITIRLKGAINSPFVQPNPNY